MYEVCRSEELTTKLQKREKMQNHHTEILLCYSAQPPASCAFLLALWSLSNPRGQAQFVLKKDTAQVFEFRLVLLNLRYYFFFVWSCGGGREIR